jgi:hypothetical protein
MTSIDLRPLSLGELLDRTFTLYRNRFWLFVGIMAVPQSFFLVLQVGVSLIVRPEKLGVTPGTDPTPQALLASLTTLFAYALPLGIIAYAIYHLAMGATTEAVSQVYLGGIPTIGASYRSVRGRIGALMAVTFLVLLGFIVVWFGPMLLTSTLLFGLAGSGTAGTVAAMLAALFGVLFFFGGGALAVWFVLRYSLAIPVLILEKIGIWSSLRRSANLTAGFRGRIFLLWLLMVVITYAGVLLFQGPFLIATAAFYKSGDTPLWFRALSTTLGGLGGILTGPLYLIGAALIYYDIRVRKEALDIQLMMAGMPEVSRGPTGPATSFPSS